MPTITELQAKRAELAKEIRALADKPEKEKRAAFTAEEQANWDKLNKDYDENKAVLDREIRAADIEAEAQTPINSTKIGRENVDHQPEEADTERRTSATAEDYERSLLSWVKSGEGLPLSDAEQRSCKLAGINPYAKSMPLTLLATRDFRKVQKAYATSHPSLAEERALSAFTAASGGTLTSLGTVIPRLELAMLAFGGMGTSSEILRTSTGETIQWPTADDTSNSGAQIPESGASTTADPTTAARTWTAWKFYSKAVKVPYELLEDSVVDVPSIIGSMLGERLARIRNTRCTTGTGAGTVNGLITVLTGISASVSAASATAIAADDLIDLQHGIDPSFRSLPGIGWMMHDTIIKALRKLKDGEGRHMWQSGLNTGSPDSLLGYPITINQDMDSTIASGKKTIVYGHLPAYKIREVNGIRLYRLDQLYRENDQDGFVAYMRFDGNLLYASTTYPPMKYLAH